MTYIWTFFRSTGIVPVEARKLWQPLSKKSHEIKEKMVSSDPVANPGVPGGTNSRGANLVFQKNFVKNCMKMKESGLRGDH